MKKEFTKRPRCRRRSFLFTEDKNGSITGRALPPEKGVVEMDFTFAYTFDLSSDRKVLKFRGDCREDYTLFHELSWTIYGNSILNIIVESNADRDALVVAELHSNDANNVLKTASLLEEGGRANLNFQNVNFLTSDPWRCVIRVVPHLQLQDAQESTTGLPPATSTQKVAGVLKRSRLEQLSADLHHLLKTGEFSDVTLTDGAVAINAHKTVLSARSPVFAKMFQHPMRENCENRVTISDVPVDVLKELVSYIYTGTVTVRDAKMARNLYIAADKYAVSDLGRICSEILQNVSPEDVLDTLLLADLYEDKILKRSALDFLARNYSLIKNSNNWEVFMKGNQALAIEILSFVIENKIQ